MCVRGILFPCLLAMWKPHLVRKGATKLVSNTHDLERTDSPKSRAGVCALLCVQCIDGTGCSHVARLACLLAFCWRKEWRVAARQWWILAFYLYTLQSQTGTYLDLGSMQILFKFNLWAS